MGNGPARRRYDIERDIRKLLKTLATTDAPNKPMCWRRQMLLEALAINVTELCNTMPRPVAEE